MIPLTAKCERTASGELALTLFAEAAAIQFRADGENLKARPRNRHRRPDAPMVPRAPTANSFTATVPAAKWEEARKQSITYPRQWKPAADVTSLRVIVHDVRSGQYGTLDVPLDKLPRSHRP